MASAIRDVTDRRLAEEALESNRKALAQSNDQLIAANKELEAFSYSVSHDLRAPVRHIDGFARLLGETYGEEMPQQVRHYIERILAAADHMGHLVDSLLNLARIGRKELIRLEAVCLGDLARKCRFGFLSRNGKTRNRMAHPRSAYGELRPDPLELSIF